MDMWVLAALVQCSRLGQAVAARRGSSYTRSVLVAERRRVLGSVGTALREGSTGSYGH